MKLLSLNLITPEKKETFNIRYLSLEDVEGSLGIYPEHQDFITVLTRSIGHFVDQEGKKIYIAYDYGILNVEKNRVSLVTRTAVKGESVEEIKEELSKRISRIEVFEKKLRENIQILERMIMKQIVEVERG
ncbi:MAG TPA: F0F1 ATP synthase subunit epsilon [Persephonella sp.]|uniref:ATP synthase F1, epsilon subunit n=1 Tax=Persephonella marina (strain DSM 14350 / EX-H1) TaxID=123214 RepID=C0QS13_PERMH|nr:MULTISPECIES: F0F1 ATP synthase subunit epsilon [Persephonella]ACO03434.1 ATP synthase F1, epsilon subunit [Persephonella marina EX-H1]HCB69204.1 F0F1 ATP synthase subunit epsilon [Persephonella sp.]